MSPAASAPLLSVLDQSPIGAGFSPADSLRASVELAQAAGELGYIRYWTADHHGSPGFAGCAPEILAAVLPDMADASLGTWLKPSTAPGSWNS